MSAELEQYLDSISEEARKGSFFTYAKKFDDFAKGNYDKQTVNKFLDKLRRDDYSDGTIDFVFGIIRSFFKKNGIPWPFHRLEGPVVRETEVRQVALHPELIKRMIETGKNGALTGQETAFLVLSTTYGVRRSELIGIRPSDIDLKNGIIFVETLKHGRQRYHLVPEEIKPYLRRYDFSTPVSASGASQLFCSIEHKCYGKHIPDAGWHSPRRTLTTLLLNSGVPTEVVHDFLRWKAITMPQRYHATRFTGLEEETVVLGKEAQEVDQLVFSKHPFLAEWAEPPGG